MNVDQFEQEWKSLKKRNDHGSFEYADPSNPASRVITSHFRTMARLNKNGVYVIRQQTTCAVLYIGKGGTIKQDGKFKKQYLPGRLKNKHYNVSGNIWFRNLLNEHGPLVIEYLLLAPTPQSPALVEAKLVQLYLNQHGCLPVQNTTL